VKTAQEWCSEHWEEWPKLDGETLPQLIERIQRDAWEQGRADQAAYSAACTVSDRPEGWSRTPQVPKFPGDE